MVRSTSSSISAELTLAAMRGTLAIRDAVGACFMLARQLDARRAGAFAVAAALMMAADPAFAQTSGGGGDITTFLQNIVNLITGTAGKLIAVIAICIVGIGALMGALSMRAAGGVILGVLLIFSASWIVNQIIGS